MRLTDRIFGCFLDLAMRSRVIARERPEALKDARGEVLEIGFGTGLNLPFYPSGVMRLSVVDPADLVPSRTAERIAAARFPVERAIVGAEHLPFDDRFFDCVVSTFTLCTIPDVASALREVRRVLKPGGSFLFLEHGLSDVPAVARWQRRLNPIQRAIGGGCNLTRPIDRIILGTGFRIVRLDRYLIAGMPRTHATMYRGVAVPAA
jgi:ubiquinone/menaquinone biosynthesis C-methylase UbiE